MLRWQRLPRILQLRCIDQWSSSIQLLTSELRRRLSGTNSSYPVPSPVFRSDKVVPVSYCRLGIATQVPVTTGRFSKASIPLRWHCEFFRFARRHESFCALGSKPTLLLITMESQTEAVRQDIRGVKDEKVEVKQELAIAKQELAIAKQAGNKGGEEEVRFLQGRLEKLDSQLLSLNTSCSV
ncbi:TPA: hypothetical protein ACH3X1_004340 [Trebouxia sp. C0004]